MILRESKDQTERKRASCRAAACGTPRFPSSASPAMRRGASASPTEESCVASSKSAFTLFELLVTMAVISVVVGIGFYSIARGTDDRALEKGADMLHSMIRVARTQAIANGVHARLIINANANDPDSYLRQIGVVIEDPESGYLQAVDRGALLPEGVFLVPQGNDVTLPADWPALGRRSVYRANNEDTTDDTAVFEFEYPMKNPVAVGTEDAPKWICVPFAPNGRLATCDGSDYVNKPNLLVIAKGAWLAGKVIVSDSEAFIGIAFKRNGSSFRTTENSLIDDQS